MKNAFTAAASVCAVFAFGAAAAAEKYPVKPITAIVAVEAGADDDVLVRPILQSVSKMLG